MKLIEVAQGSAEWLQHRMGRPSASELDRLISPTLKLREGEGPHTYLCEKLAEKWTGQPVQSWSGGSMEQGSILEDEAIPFLELRLGVTIERPGIIVTDDERFVCSPDGLIPTVKGFEIKCPEQHTHVKWLLGGECPREHWMQCQGGMYATGLPLWTFASYRRGFPPLIVDVERDEEAMERIAEAVNQFSAKMARGWDALCDANGGPPEREAVMTEAESDEANPF